MRILSGIQPSGVLHIGNYFGMMQPAIALQDEGEAFYFIADYHALTSVRDPEVLRANVRRVARRFSCVRTRSRARYALQAERCAAGNGADAGSCRRSRRWDCSSAPTPTRTNSRADFAPTSDYSPTPSCMAADILIYDSDIVPVGKDQKQHIEMTRDLAVKDERDRSDTIFKLPEARIQACNASLFPVSTARR